MKSQGWTRVTSGKSLEWKYWKSGIQEELSYLTGCGDVSKSAPGLQLNSVWNVAAFILENFFV